MRPLGPINLFQPLSQPFRFLNSIAMAPADHGSRTAPPPPISNFLADDLDLFESVLSWARGVVPQTGAYDVAAAEAAMEAGRASVSIQKSYAVAASTAYWAKDEPGVQDCGCITLPTMAPGLASMMADYNARIAAEDSARAGGPAGSAAGSGAGAAAATAQATRAIQAAAAAENLRVHATGLVSAVMFLRHATDFVVSKGFVADLVSRLREGPVAEYLRAEAAKGRPPLPRQATPLSAATSPAGTTPTAAISAAAGAGAAGAPPPAVGGKAPEAGAGALAGQGTVGVVGGGEGKGGGDRYESEWGFGRWSCLAAVEAEHVTACISGVGGYQEVERPWLFFSRERRGRLGVLVWRCGAAGEGGRGRWHALVHLAR